MNIFSVKWREIQVAYKNTITNDACCQTVKLNIKQYNTMKRSIWMAKTCSNQAATLGEMCSYVLFLYFLF